jgi:aldehyde dehydrogenase
MELIGDLIPPGVVNIVNGIGAEAGDALANSPRIAKVAFTGSSATGGKIMSAASKNMIPITLELGGKSPNIFFSSVMAKNDSFLDKCVEGAVMFALNQGEVCTCPSRMLVQEDIFDEFVARVVERTKAIKIGHPLDPSTMIGAQASALQYEKIQNYLRIGTEEGAKVLCGGKVAKNVDGGYYIEPTILAGNNKMRVFQEEVSVCSIIHVKL